MDFLLKTRLEAGGKASSARLARILMLLLRGTIEVVSSMALQHALWCSFFESIKIWRGGVGDTVGNWSLSMNLSERNPPFQGEVKRSPWGFHLSMSLRNPAKPALSTLAHCAAVNRIERCSSISLAGFGGLPIGFFSVFISQLSVIQKVLQFITYCNSIRHMQLTYKFRLRDTCDSELTRQARAVSYVWNYCNETQQQAVKRKRKCKWDKK